MIFAVLTRDVDHYIFWRRDNNREHNFETKFVGPWDFLFCFKYRRCPDYRIPGDTFWKSLCDSIEYIYDQRNLDFYFWTCHCTECSITEFLSRHIPLCRFLEYIQIDLYEFRHTYEFWNWTTSNFKLGHWRKRVGLKLFPDDKYFCNFG
jgi:hypothetical protein